MTAAAVLAAITAFLELAKLEFAAAPVEDQRKLAAIHAHILEGLSDILTKLHDDTQTAVDKLKSVIGPPTNTLKVAV